jgi:DNA-binding NarL/FixJ family response regulator
VLAKELNMGSTLMIVEDHLIFRSMVKKMFQEWFPALAIVEAGDVPEALQCAAAHAPEVILMDIHLPGGSGLHATRRIKEDLPGTIVIVCTSDNCELYRKAAFESGAAHFIPKSEFFFSTLRSLVEAAFASAENKTGDLP